MTHDTHGASAATARMVAALRDPGYQFTQEQMLRLIWLAIGTWDDLAWRDGYEAGYRARVAEENAAWPPPPVFAFGEWQSMTERQAYRERLDADRTQRYTGGPVEVW